MTAAAAAPALATSPTVSSGDPPDGHHRRPQRARHLAERVEPAGLGGDLLRPRGEHGAEPDVIRAGGDRRARLGERPRAPPHQQGRPDDAPGLAGRQVVVADVDPVGPGEERQVGPVVHDHERAIPAERHDLPRRGQHRSGRGGLHPHLDDTGAALHREPGPPDRVVVADDGVEPAQASEPGAVQVGKILHDGAHLHVA